MKLGMRKAAAPAWSCPGQTGAIVGLHGAAQCSESWGNLFLPVY